MTGIVAEGEEDQEELEIVLGPNQLGRRVDGVVGSILKA